MVQFTIDSSAIAAQAEDAGERAARGDAHQLASALERGEALDDLAVATLFLARDVSTDQLVDLARSRRPAGAPQLETFSPLYFSNECDGECRMCGMREGNAGLRRETADASTIRGQLDTLTQRGMRGVAVLSGEYRHGERRQRMLARAAPYFQNECVGRQMPTHDVRYRCFIVFCGLRITLHRFKSYVGLRI